MQKLKLTAILSATLGLTACGTFQPPVAVVKADKDSTIVRVSESTNQNTTEIIPQGVTALCWDGAYSKATDNSVCSGNGGVKTYIGRYHSE